MSKRASDVLARMKATTNREKPISTSAIQLPELPSGEAAHPHARPTRARRVRYTLDLEPEQHKALKRFALEADVDASQVLRALLTQLESDTALRSAILTALDRG